MTRLARSPFIFVAMSTFVGCSGGNDHSRTDGGAGSGGAVAATGGSGGSASGGRSGGSGGGGGTGTGGAAGQGAGSGGRGGGAGSGQAGAAGQVGTGGRGGEQGGRTGTGGAAGTGGAGGASSCGAAVAQQSCSLEGAVCSSGCTDICQFCNQLRCTGGIWQAQEVAPAPCFSCGPDLRCQQSAQYCYVIAGGAVGRPPSYQCPAVPGACLPTPTCACLQTQSISGSANCQQAAAGQLTVTLLVP